MKKGRKFTTRFIDPNQFLLLKLLASFVLRNVWCLLRFVTFKICINSAKVLSARLLIKHKQQNFISDKPEQKEKQMCFTAKVVVSLSQVRQWEATSNRNKRKHVLHKSKLAKKMIKQFHYVRFLPKSSCFSFNYWFWNATTVLELSTI